LRLDRKGWRVAELGNGFAIGHAASLGPVSPGENLDSPALPT
jgi:hypothetical protein